jgi:uncharacterized RmlC-like cupin family protein
MTETLGWRTEGVKVVRAESIRKAQLGSFGVARATAFDFTGAGGQETWVGVVSHAPNAKTRAHHHGRHEVAVYVIKGHGQIRWGERLEFAAEIAPGDFVYFAPYVPHQELNTANETLDFVVVRSDNEGFFFNLDIDEVERPEHVKDCVTNEMSPATADR